MISLRSVVVVEGKYDKIKLENIIDAVIITTDGFRIFKDKEKITMLKALSKKEKIIIMTDSDSAGGIIRSYLKNCIGTDNVINIYLPQILGKEKRKEKASSEGFIGVEGTDDSVITEALTRFGVTYNKADNHSKGCITKKDLYFCGLSGGKDSSVKRKAFLKHLDLPENLSTNSLIDVLNVLYDNAKIKKLISNFFGNEMPDIYS